MRVESRIERKSLTLAVLIYTSYTHITHESVETGEM